MPSYRRDRPGAPAPGGRPSGPPPRFRREEQEPEEETPSSFRRPSFLRREGLPSEFASRPVGPAERRELWEVLVPESEREDPYFDYDKVFEILPRLRRGQAPPPPPREAPPRAEPTRPARGPGQPPVVDAGRFFDLGRIWNAVAALRRDPRFKAGSPVAVVRTAPQAEVDRFFGVGAQDVAAFLDELSYAINAEKPRELPGRFLFQRGHDGFVWLAYVE